MDLELVKVGMICVSLEIGGGGERVGGPERDRRRQRARRLPRRGDGAARRARRPTHPKTNKSNPF